MPKVLIPVLILSALIGWSSAHAGEAARPCHVSALQPGGRDSPAAETYSVGTRPLAVAAPERGGVIDATLWYPTGSSGRRVVVGDDNPLFQGTPALADSAIREGCRPLVVLSQGGLRSGPNIGAWMASRLAAKGFVVAMLRQPDPRHLTEAQTLPEIWLRPADISAALTAILGNADLSRHIDPDRIGVLGYQIGGTAALSLAGGRLDAASVQASCDAGGVGVDCGRFRKAGLDLRTIDAERLGRPNADARIRAIVVVDPEFSRDFTRASLENISIPVSLVNLGRPEALWPGLDAQGLTRSIRQARYDAVPDATQFSAFPLCKPGAADILRSDGEEAICDDPLGGRGRGQIHDALAQRVAAAFRSSF